MVQLDAILFDLDGVITRTAKIHAATWKQLFDAYLQARAEQSGEPFQPFEIETDYRIYVDGVPRYDGVKNFLASRGMVLPEGRPDDAPEQETICGLGNAKQAYFLAQLQEVGVEVYDTTLDLIRQAKAHGLKVAVISSSKNCADVLESAGITALFDARVDGVESERLGLRGKPDPAIFLEAARQLGVDPARAAVVEDAIAGVQAGRDGHFALVVGIDRDHHAEELKSHGADVVVHDLSELAISDARSIREATSTHRQKSVGGLSTAGPTNSADSTDEPFAVRSTSPPATTAPLPDASGCLDDMIRMAGRRPIVVFLDYDGTLTPIVSRPEDANLSMSMRTVLEKLAERCMVAVVSGRDLADVRERVHLDPLYYAGSHGFEIAGPNGFHEVYGPARTFLAALDQAERALHERLEPLPGVQVERKHFAIAVHVRRARDEDVPTVVAAVNAVHQQHTGLRQTEGKKVFELRPDLDWNKGTALFWLLDTMGLERDAVLPLYIGDDVTDEDAFVALRDTGVGIVVTEGAPRPTAARYALANTESVRTFLTSLTATRTRSHT